MNYADLVVKNLPLIDGVVRVIARRHWLSADEADELKGAIHLKLVENDYQVLRKFEGRCQLKTYLTTVVERHFLDERNARWGKWRPSAQARRLGPTATLLDQLLTRDNMPFEQAVLAIRSRCGDSVSREELHAIMLQLPFRNTRQFVDEKVLDNVPAPSPNENEMIQSLEQARTGDRVERALANALAKLGDEDRLILKLRFCDSIKLKRIAELVGHPEKPFYRRVFDLMRVLREELQAAGVSEADVIAIIEHPDSGMGPVLE